MAGVALDQELVRAFVGAAHADLEKVQHLLEQEPGLLHAAMNWGGGDWETALGAASHVGRRDIALWLLEKGARLDLFAAAMLGELEFVQAALTKYPQQVHAAGPHQISLLQHALMGGEQAKPVADYIRSLLGDEDGRSQDMILVENRIEVRAGYADAVLERFKTPKTVHTFPGFIRMDVLHAKNSDGNEEICVCTTWENEEAFDGWASSDSFRGAHAKRAEAGEKSATESGNASEAGHAKGAHGSAANNGPIIGNKVTIYRVAASHLPEAASEGEAAIATTHLEKTASA